jgi:hypothetical protein
MGLDMYVEKVINPEDPSPIHLVTEADYVPFDGAQVEQFWYWRKHPNLHGWMENLYYRKGGKSDTFNTVNVVLTKEDLERLEKDIQAGKLPYTAGFFFGESDGSEKDEDLEFIRKAKEAIDGGAVLYYTSWW